MRGIIPQIHQAGAKLIVIGNGTAEQAQWYLEATRLDTPVYTDPERNVYRAIEARRGWNVVLHPMVLWRALQALRGGYRQAGLMGDATQVGGLLIIKPDGSIPYVHRSSYVGDSPRPAAILKALKQARVSVA